MSVEAGQDGTVHYPKRRDVFEFDEDVASHFEEMADRSIPMYREVHRLHVSMLLPRLVDGATIVDVGSSTGRTFKTIEKALGRSLLNAGLHTFAIDSSQPMMDRLSRAFPTVACYTRDLRGMPNLPRQADIMFAYYVLQFVPQADRALVVKWMQQNIKVGGILVLGQKDNIKGAEAEPMFSEEYYKFRRDNGYTQQEIEAKTLALRNSMWPVTTFTLCTDLLDFGFEYQETTRWLQFSTGIAIRRY